MRNKLVLSFIVILLSSFAFANAQKIKSVNSTEVNAMLSKANKIVVLDVRTADEFAMGHVKGAINIDIRQADATSRIDKLDKKATYVVHCRTNRRSQIAVDHMVQAGFTNIYQMMDGMMGWNQNNLPVVK